MPVVVTVAWWRLVALECSKKGLHEFAGRTSEYARWLSGQSREFLSSIETSVSSPRKIEGDKRPPRCRSHAGTHCHSSAEARLDAAGLAVQANIEVSVATARQSVQSDMRHPVSAEFELDQIEIVWPVLLFAPWHARGDRNGLFREKVSTQIKDMCAKIHGRALRRFSTPASLGLLGYEKGLVHDEEDELAELSLANHPLGGPMDAHETELIVDNDVPTGISCQASDRVSFVEIGRKRLLAEHMAAGLKAKVRECEMGLRWCHHRKDMRLGSLQHLGGRGEDGERKLRCLCHGIASAHYFKGWNTPIGREMNSPRGLTKSGDGNTVGQGRLATSTNNESTREN